MASSIDPTKPTATDALTSDVRANFQAAKDEIEALQTGKTAVADLADTTDVAKGDALIGVFLSVTGFVGRTLSSWISSRPYYASDFGCDMTGATDNTTELQAAITAASGKELHIDGKVLVTSGLTGVSNTVIKGVGRDATIKTATADINLWTFTSNSDITIENLKFEMVVGTNQSFNLCLVFSACSNVTVKNCEFSGMSGDGVRGTGGTTYLTVEDCYFHDFTGSLQDSSDINFYNDCTFSSAINNKCFGGNWHGIKFQIDSRDNIALGNRIGAHTAYGIACYETTPSETRNEVIGNKIEGITGDALIGGVKTAGAGIYILGNGAALVANNTVKNCNINTTTETLTPGGIGVSAPTQPISITGNVVTGTQWYGIAVFSCTQHVNVSGNTVNEAVKTAIYAKNSSYVNINGNNITQVTNVQRAIYSVDSTTARDQTTIVGNNIRGSSLAIEVNNIDNSIVMGNTVTDCSDRGIHLQNLDGCTVVGNVIHESGNNCIRLNNAINVDVNSNTLQAATAVTNSIETVGTCTGSIITALVRNKAINNAATGCQGVFRADGAAPSGTFQTGDITWDTGPAAGAREMGFVYIGAWKRFGDIDA